MSAKRIMGAMLIAVVTIVAVVLLVPGFATIIGGMIANLWITVMAAVVGILGGFMGS